MLDPSALIPSSGSQLSRLFLRFCAPARTRARRFQPSGSSAWISTRPMRAGGRGTRPCDGAPPPRRPKTIDYQNIDFDIFGSLLSFYVRSVNILVSQDLDAQTIELGLSGGTGKISTILLTGANPGIRPSVLAHFIRKDRSAMGKLLEHDGTGRAHRAEGVSGRATSAGTLSHGQGTRPRAANPRRGPSAGRRIFRGVLSAGARAIARPVAEGLRDFLDMVPNANDGRRSASSAEGGRPNGWPRPVASL